eukprot:scaffold52751_cov69-Phaeocystis_antarctica.AAC.6
MGEVAHRSARAARRAQSERRRLRWGAEEEAEQRLKHGGEAGVGRRRLSSAPSIATMSLVRQYCPPPAGPTPPSPCNGPSSCQLSARGAPLPVMITRAVLVASEGSSSRVSRCGAHTLAANCVSRPSAVSARPPLSPLAAIIAALCTSASIATSCRAQSAPIWRAARASAAMLVRSASTSSICARAPSAAQRARAASPLVRDRHTR